MAIVEMTPGHTEEGRRYEDAVLGLLGRHGGEVERRTRSTDGNTEVHLIRFQQRAGLDAFMADPERLALRSQVGEAAPVARVIEVTDV